MLNPGRAGRSCQSATGTEQQQINADRTNEKMSRMGVGQNNLGELQLILDTASGQFQAVW
jgi:hypothetical protein